MRAFIFVGPVMEAEGIARRAVAAMAAAERFYRGLYAQEAERARAHSEPMLAQARDLGEASADMLEARPWLALMPWRDLAVLTALEAGGWMEAGDGDD